jgi:hypothetical protein
MRQVCRYRKSHKRPPKHILYFEFQTSPNSKILQERAHLLYKLGTTAAVICIQLPLVGIEISMSRFLSACLDKTRTKSARGLPFAFEILTCPLPYYSKALLVSGNNRQYVGEFVSSSDP